MKGNTCLYNYTVEDVFFIRYYFDFEMELAVELGYNVNFYVKYNLES